MHSNTQGIDPKSIEGGLWRIDPDRSKVEFQTGLFWGLSTVKGQFGRFSGTMDVSAEPAIELTIEADSLDSRNARRDKHLRSEDFFGVERFPEVRFISDSVRLEGERLKVRGRLHAAGRQAQLKVDASLKQLDDELELIARAQVDQRLLGMTFSPMRMIGSPSTLLVEGRLVR